MKLALILSIAFMHPMAHAGLDEDLSKASQWDEPELAREISDYGLAAYVAGPILLTGLHTGWKEAGVVSGAYAFNFGLTYALKKIVHRERPDKSDFESFPSGHTSTAFLGAAIVCSQVKREHCAIALGGAGTVAAMRVFGWKHNWGDTIGGALIAWLTSRTPQLVITFRK